jgi:anti-sigma B factor antagonist
MATPMGETLSDAEGYDSRILEVHGEAVLEMRGELDLASRERAEADLLAAERATTGDVVLDMRQVHFMGSVGLGVLIAASLRMQEAGRSLVLVPGEACGRLIELAGLTDRFTVRAAGS